MMKDSQIYKHTDIPITLFITQSQSDSVLTVDPIDIDCDDFGDKDIPLGNYEIESDIPAKTATC